MISIVGNVDGIAYTDNQGTRRSSRRSYLAAAGIGGGRHAFDVVIPGGLPRGAMLRVQRAADGAALAERRCA